MSLLHLENQTAYRYGIWKTEETVETLSRLSGCLPPDRLTNLVRMAEYLAVRALAKAMDIDPHAIAYQPSGKPFLTNDSLTISISHTKRYVAVLVSPLPMAAIDIETRSPRVLRVRHKFMHPSEEALLQQSGRDETIGLLLHWCIKEAVFKAIPDEGVDFVQEIRVTQLTDLHSTTESPISGRLEAIADRQGLLFKGDYRIESDFVLTACFSGTL